LAGVTLTAILYLLTRIPSRGPTIFTLATIPFQIAAMLITKDRELGDYVYLALQILFFGALAFVALTLFRRFSDKA
jgi:hypothetical protein